MVGRSVGRRGVGWRRALPDGRRRTVGSFYSFLVIPYLKSKDIFCFTLIFQKLTRSSTLLLCYEYSIDEWMDGLTLPYRLRQILGLKHNRFRYTMIYSVFTLGIPFEDKDIFTIT